MSDASLVDVDLEVIASFKTLVAEEMDFVILALDELQTETLVPPLWEHIKRNLSADRILESELRELGFEGFDKRLANPSTFVELLKFVALLD